MKQITLIALLLGVLLNGLNVQAAQTTAYVTLRGKLIIPAVCTLQMSNNNIHFGDVLSTRIDGVNYQRKAVGYTLACDRTPTGTLTMTLTGTPGGNGALGTSINNLGIAFYNGSTRLTLNNALAFSYTNQPTLFAVPTKAAGATLSTGGYFSATANLVINYN
ncbi:fimbrial protein [Serratia oryzae]|uniref:fimbrial protein n=1 Tax=Serratia oryzae TaxID=2034155 RepID=UPI0012E23B61|nr:fimbrial protein [Serratia oryzae]